VARLPVSPPISPPPPALRCTQGLYDVHSLVELFFFPHVDTCVVPRELQPVSAVWVLFSRFFFFFFVGCPPSPRFQEIDDSFLSSPDSKFPFVGGFFTVEPILSFYFSPVVFFFLTTRLCETPGFDESPARGWSFIPFSAARVFFSLPSSRRGGKNEPSSLRTRTTSPTVVRKISPPLLLFPPQAHPFSQSPPPLLG